MKYNDKLYSQVEDESTLFTTEQNTPAKKNDKSKKVLTKVGIGLASGAIAGGGAGILASSMQPEENVEVPVDPVDTVTPPDQGGDATATTPNHGAYPDLNMDALVNDLDIATGVNNDMSFQQAFAAARAEVGAGGAFEWRGRVYSTFYENEWNNMSPAARAEFQSHFAWNHHGHNDVNNIASNDTHPLDGEVANNSGDDNDPSLTENKVPTDGESRTGLAGIMGNNGDPEPIHGSFEPEPITGEPEPEPINGEPEPIVGEPEPEPINGEPEPIFGEPEPVFVDPEPEPIIEPNPLANNDGEINATGETDPVFAEPEPSIPEPEPIVGVNEPDPLDDLQNLVMPDSVEIIGAEIDPVDEGGVFVDNQDAIFINVEDDPEFGFETWTDGEVQSTGFDPLSAIQDIVSDQIDPDAIDDNPAMGDDVFV